ncbi:MAG: LPS export ABC transporter periplasmic protein LptC [Henriciella sp.]
MNAAHTEMLARWAPQRQMTLAQARRRSSFVSILRVIFVAGAAISAGVIIGPIVATTLSGAGQQIDKFASDEVVTMVNARFTGRNISGEAYVITAEEARRRRADPSVINLTNPRLVDDKGTQVSAPVGVFYQNEEYLDLFQDVKVRDAEGYEFTTTAARAFVQSGHIQGLEPLNGIGPLGDVRADSYEIEDEGDRIIFRGNVDMTIYPDGKEDTETTETEE